MATRNGYAEGIPAWVDLGTPDVPGALAFYAALFDWEYREETPAPAHTTPPCAAVSPQPGSGRSKTER